MNHVIVPLLLLVGRVTRLAPLGIFGISPLGEILLRGDCEDEFLSTFTADEDPRLEPVHLLPSRC